MSNPNKRITGLALKVGPLGENDRLITILTEHEGILKFAIPGARRPKSSLSATSPLTLLELDVVGRRSLKKVKQIKILKSFSKIGKELDALAAAQAIVEICLMTIGNSDPNPSLLEIILLHLTRLECINKKNDDSSYILAVSVQSCIHLFALSGYSIPLHICSRSGEPLVPPIGDWGWRCSLLPNEGIIEGALSNADIQLNPSELALLQRLTQPHLPYSKNGLIMGPKYVWLKFIKVIQSWARFNIGKEINSLKMIDI